MWRPKKNVGELRGDIGAVPPSSRKFRPSPPNKRPVQPGDAFEDTASEPEFNIVEF
jgi:hypothetical protein